MVRINAKHFSAEQICESGQCFRMKKIGEDEFSLIAKGKYLKLKQDKNEILFDCSQEEYESIWKQYFDMETDYQKVIEMIPREDGYLLQAAYFGEGIRILRQDIWEMIITFLISQQNNIKRIRRCIETLCEKYGEKRTAEDGSYYFDFPDVQTLSQVTEEELRACNLGYRSRYIASTARSIAGNEVSLESLTKMDYTTARAELMKLCGIGVKVADCICLFALHQTEAFPVDTHINQVLKNRYASGFPFERYKNTAGIIQQYIFYYDLKKNAV